MPAGKQAAQICRSDEEIPNVLLPVISKSGTVRPISGPASHQGQGCFIHTAIFMVLAIRRKDRKIKSDTSCCLFAHGDKNPAGIQPACIIFEQRPGVLKTRFQDVLIEAGCDEAGRGCYAGPVFAAAVVLPPDFFHPLLNDSKQLSAEERYELRPLIEQKAIDCAVGVVGEAEIDTLNILWASVKAMHIAVGKLKKIKPGLLLIDGNRFKKYKRTPHQCIIKGDSLYASIAAASILAKTYRDDYMVELHEQFPQYQWNSNKGYGTELHRKAIEEHGTCIHHRKSFNILPRRFSEQPGQ